MKKLIIKSGNTLASFVRDPLCHLLIIGSVVYGVTQSPDNEPDPHTIEVTQEFVSQLEQQFQHSYLRRPTPEEKQQLINNAVMDLALYREGLQYNLDQADEVVKRRVIQKMNFIIEGMADPGVPDIGDLANFLQEHPEQFRLPPRYSFEHRFFSGHSASSHARAQQTLAALQQPDTASAIPEGDYFLRGRQFNQLDPEKINGIFGNQFAQHLRQQPLHQWQGPFPSTYGLHLVLIREAAPERTPDLAEVKDQVYAAWKRATTEENVNNIRKQVLARYDVNLKTGGHETAADSNATTSPEAQRVALN